MIGINNFVLRQKKGTGKTYLQEISLESIVEYASIQLKNNKFKPGYRDGVILISIKNELVKYFKCPFTKITKSTVLKAEYKSRRNNEEPYIRIKACNGEPLEISSVELILYRKDVLAETNENTTNKDWELIAFHAVPKGMDSLPMGPVTMMRNQLELTGGTKGCYSSKEWAESVQFWQHYAIIE